MEEIFFVYNLYYASCKNKMRHFQTSIRIFIAEFITIY